MIFDLTDKELDEYIELSQFRSDAPERMSDENWERYAELREIRFSG